MRIKQLIAVCLFSFGIFAGYAQEAISSGGDSYQNSQGSASVTIGEPVTETFTGTSLTLTQGMQQPTLTVTQPNSAEQKLGISVEVYPNPVCEQLRMKCDAQVEIGYILNNGIGITAMKGTFTGDALLDVASLPGGAYSLLLTKAGRSESVEIIKH